MRVDVVTLFPGMLTPFLDVSFVGKACEQGLLTVRFRSPRDFGIGVHRSVDDTPYGGGSGMVLRVDCVVNAMEALDADASPARSENRAHRILLTPQGTPFHQSIAQRLSRLDAIMLVCGRYEGFDERVRHHVDEELSLGDFVLSGGEVAAMAVIEAVVRLVPGVLGNYASVCEESHCPGNAGLLEYPQYTRPPDFRGLGVDPVLVSGNHARIASWRRDRAIERTRKRRPDLLQAVEHADRSKDGKS